MDDREGRLVASTQAPLARALCLIWGRLLWISVGTNSRVLFCSWGPIWLAGALEVAVAVATLRIDFRPGSQSKDIQMVP